MHADGDRGDRLTLESVEATLARLRGSLQQLELFAVVNAFHVPKISFDPVGKKLYEDSAPRSILAPAQVGVECPVQPSSLLGCAGGAHNALRMRGRGRGQRAGLIDTFAGGWQGSCWRNRGWHLHRQMHHGLGRPFACSSHYVQAGAKGKAGGACSKSDEVWRRGVQAAGSNQPGCAINIKSERRK